LPQGPTPRSATEERAAPEPAGQRQDPSAAVSTRDRLYLAAEELVVEQGYEATTVAEIALRAGAARRTVFNHFPTKGAIAIEWAARRRARARSTLRVEEKPVDRIRAYFAEMGRITEGQPELTREMMIGWLGAGGPIGVGGPWVSDDLLHIATETHAEARLPPDPHTQACIHLLSDAYLGTLLRWMRSDPAPGEFAVALKQAVEMVLAVLETVKADR
jgi:AcrR family transcriptional regulator